MEAELKKEVQIQAESHPIQEEFKRDAVEDHPEADKKLKEVETIDLTPPKVVKKREAKPRGTIVKDASESSEWTNERKPAKRKKKKPVKEKVKKEKKVKKERKDKKSKRSKSKKSKKSKKHSKEKDDEDDNEKDKQNAIDKEAKREDEGALPPLPMELPSNHNDFI